jgi:hypothetical protein
VLVSTLFRLPFCPTTTNVTLSGDQAIDDQVFVTGVALAVQLVPFDEVRIGPVSGSPATAARSRKEGDQATDTHA